MKTRTVALGSALTCLGGAALAQGGHMTNDMWGGGWFGPHGGTWIPILLVVAVVGAIIFIIRRK